MKLVLIGGGNIGVTDESKPYTLRTVHEEIVNMSGKKFPRVLYIGFNQRADYYFGVLKKSFSELGAQCSYLSFREFDNEKTVESKFKRADIIYLPGGNTLSYMRLIKKHGLGKYILESVQNDKVVSGISAGAIMLCKFGSSDARKSEILPKKYTKVTGLGFVDALFVPHFSTSDRKFDIERMMKSTKNKVAIACDENCAIEIDGEHYKVLISEKGAKAFKCFYRKDEFFVQELEQVGLLKDLLSIK